MSNPRTHTKGYQKYTLCGLDQNSLPKERIARRNPTCKICRSGWEHDQELRKHCENLA